MVTNKDEGLKNYDYSIDSAKLKIVGELIQGAREEKSLAIEHLADKLQIDKERLISLENGDKKNLPENVYIVGIIRQVSRILKINGDELIKELAIDSSEIIEIVSQPKKISFLERIKSLFSLRV